MVASSRQTTDGQTKSEFLLPLAATVSLLLSCVITSRKKYFWNDELLSFYLISDPSFPHMLGALGDTINNAPPLYFTAGWLWARVFGPSEVSLRLFSSLTICLAFTMTWKALRSTYSFWSASLATLAVFSFSDLILQQNAEARFYGLFLAVCSFGLAHYVSLARTRTPSLMSVALGVVIHALMIQTHLFGFVYSAAILLALLIQDLCFPPLRPKTYLSILSGWLTFVPWIGSFLKQLALADPRSWIPTPSLSDLVHALTLPRDFFIVFITAGLIILFYNAWCTRAHGAQKFLVPSLVKEDLERVRVETSLLIFAYALLTVPVAVWVFSHAIEPIFVHRYFIPISLSWAIILAALLSRLPLPSPAFHQPDPDTPPGILSPMTSQLIIPLSLTFLFLVGPLYYGLKFPRQPLPGARDDIPGYADLPIAVEFSHPFLQRFHYSSSPHRYFFVLDWDAALDKRSGLFSPGEYRTLDALTRNYPAIFGANILQYDAFVRRFNRFLVLNYDQNCTPKHVACPVWYELRIEGNLAFRTRKIDRVDGLDLILVDAQR